MSNESIRATFRLNPLRFVQLQVIPKRTASLSGLEPLPFDTLSEIVKDSFRPLIPERFSLKVSRSRSSVPSPELPAVQGRITAALGGIDVWTGLGMSYVIDSYSGHILSLVNTNGLDYSEFLVPHTWQMGLSMEAGVQKAIAVYQATEPFAEAWIEVQDTVLSVPWKEGPMNRLSLTSTHVLARSENRLMPFHRIVVHSLLRGELRIQVVLVDARTGEATALLRMGPVLQSNASNDSRSSVFKLAKGASLNIPATGNSIVVEEQTAHVPSSSESKRPLVARIRESLFLVEVFPRSRILLLRGEAWKYSGPLDLSRLDGLKPLPPPQTKANQNE